MPPIHIEHMVTPSPLTPGGMKGMGEGGCIGALAVVANAVADALAPFDARVTALPLRPDVLLAMMDRPPTTGARCRMPAQRAVRAAAI